MSLKDQLNGELDETITIRISDELLERIDSQLPSADRSTTIRQLLIQALEPKMTDSDETELSDMGQFNQEALIEQLHEKDRQLARRDEQISELVSILQDRDTES